MNLNTNFWNGKKVLVTGHTGFKGSWLSVWLQKLGASVFGISLNPKTNPSLYAELLRDDLFSPYIKSSFIDINDFDILSDTINAIRPDVVFHLAAQPLVIQSYLDPLETWNTNVIGTLNVLQSLLSNSSSKCSVVCITTDKVYKNLEWSFGYRENDALGGHDPYSSSKAAAEIGIASFRDSFCGTGPHQSEDILICSARAGNVIGGGDWSNNRLVPDIVRSLELSTPVELRNPYATRPWQHVIEPLYGYLLLAQHQFISNSSALSVNFGPNIDSNKTVLELVDQVFLTWPGSKIILDSTQYHEANLLYLHSELAYKLLGWKPVLSFQETVELTIMWYKSFSEGHSPYQLISDQINFFLSKVCV